jgi:ubiquinone/menaquinone biosynthesis C-methylase UbiE
MQESHQRVCPVALAGSLDNFLRKLIHNPKIILHRYVKKGMSVLDIGCGPGVFTVEIANMVGENGRVIAADLQQGMLDIVGRKLDEKSKKIVKLHKCQQDSIGITEKVDFILVFYMLHEVPNKREFLAQLKSILKPSGRIFIAEPIFHVSGKAFRKSIEIANSAGLNSNPGPRVLLSRTVLLTPK